MRFCVSLILFCMAIVGCRDGPRYPDPIERDLEIILERDTLRLITETNSTSYFLHRGEPLGFEYELMRAFADDHDLVLRTIVVQNRDSLFHHLNRGDGDVVAARLLPTDIDTPYVAFTAPLYETEPVLVQQEEPRDEMDSPDTVRDLIADEPVELPDTLAPPTPSIPDSIEVRARLVEQMGHLDDRIVHLQRSTYVERLIEISDSISGDIAVVEVEGDVSAESLIRQVARGEIDLTVSQENLARLQAGYFENIHVRPAIGPSHYVSWATRRNAPRLLAALNEWVEKTREEPRFRNLYRRYFIDRRAYVARVDDEYLTSETGRLSPYDDLLKHHADEIGWDWRLLASQAFQESRFDRTAVSWAGATGLMQLMPATAREFGVRDTYDPEENVAGAVRFIQWLTDYWDERIADEQQRMRFILASYNTGHGHVEDARRLTEKYEGDPDLWAEVAVWLLQKSRREVYEDPVVRYGFSRGLEPVTYVAKILDRFDHYRQFLPDEPALDEQPVHRAAVH